MSLMVDGGIEAALGIVFLANSVAVMDASFVERLVCPRHESDKQTR